MDTAGYTWDAFPRDIPGSGAGIPGRRFVYLEQNGWQALVAFTAGPKWVTTVPVRAGRPAAVTHTVRTSEGTHTERWDAPLDEAAADGIYTDMVEYLAEAGVPAPPRDIEWVLRLPDGLDASRFWERVNDAVGAAIDAMADAQHWDTTPPELPCAGIRHALAEELNRLLGRAD